MTQIETDKLNVEAQLSDPIGFLDSILMRVAQFKPNRNIFGEQEKIYPYQTLYYTIQAIEEAKEHVEGRFRYGKRAH